jgi:hypothetical protein
MGHSMTDTREPARQVFQAPCRKRCGFAAHYSGDSFGGLWDGLARAARAVAIPIRTS